MKNQTARYTGGNSTLEVQLAAGKRGQNVRVTFRTPGEKTTSGCRELIADEAKAKARFDALCADAVKRGWTLKVGRNQFTEVPAPPTATAPVTKRGKRAQEK